MPVVKPPAPSKSKTLQDVKDLKEAITVANAKLEQKRIEVKQLEQSIAEISDDVTPGAVLNKNTKTLEKQIEEWLTSFESSVNNDDEECKSAMTAKQLVIAQQNMDLFHKVAASKRNLSRMQIETDAFRLALLEEVSMAQLDPKCYDDVPTLKLLKIYTQKLEEKARLQASNYSGKDNSDRPQTSLTLIKKIGEISRVENGKDVNANENITSVLPPESTNTIDTIDDMNKFELERQISALKDTNAKLTKRVKNIRKKVAASGAEQTRANTLQMHNSNLGERLNDERDKRNRVEDELQRANKKVAKLAEHIERLMTHLKHESTAKLKHQKVVRRMEQELGALRLRSSSLLKKMQMRERVITELKEGSKILEEQLRLMDDKYVDMRRKLDWTRDNTKQQVKKMTAEADLLRARWQLAGGANLNLGKLVSSASSQKNGSGRKVSAMLRKSKDAQKKISAAQKNS